MPSIVRMVLIVATIALLLGGPWGYLRYQDRMGRNFRVVEEGVLYRSGQLSLAGLQRIAHDYGIRTVICLRDGDREDDRLEQEYCQKAGLNHVRIQQRSWWASEGPVPAEEGLNEFRQVMDDPNKYPVLIHCFAGIHRTGAYCAVYRMDYHGWNNSDAIAEMRRLGYDTLDSDLDLHAYLENYLPNAKHPVRPVSRSRNR